MRFEYTFRMNSMSVSDMNAMGKEGWELVTILPPSTTGNSLYINYFKRQLEEPVTFDVFAAIPELAAIKVEVSDDKA